MVDDYGPEAIRAKVEERLGRKLDDFTAPESTGFADHMGVHEQKQRGLYHVGVPVPVGIVNGGQLIDMADLAASFGGDVRLTKQQNLILANVPSAQVDGVVASLSDLGLPVDANRLRATANSTAAAGSGIAGLMPTGSDSDSFASPGMQISEQTSQEACASNCLVLPGSTFWEAMIGTSRSTASR